MAPLHSVLCERGVQGSKYSRDQHKSKCVPDMPLSELVIHCFPTYLAKNNYSFKIKLIFFFFGGLINEGASEVFCLSVTLVARHTINTLMKMLNALFSSLFNKVISLDLK